MPREQLVEQAVADYDGPLSVKNNPMIVVYLYGVCAFTLQDQTVCGQPRVLKKDYSTWPTGLELICTDKSVQHRRTVENI